MNILNSYEDTGEENLLIVDKELGSSRERVERVRSLVGPRSYTTPEKLILHSDGTEGVDSVVNEWTPSQFPEGSHSVTIQRENKGFGLIIVEGKVSLQGHAYGQSNGCTYSRVPS